MCNEEKKSRPIAGLGGMSLGSMGLVPFADMQNEDLMNISILIGEGSGAPRCDASIVVNGTSLVARLDINFEEAVTLGGKHFKNAVDINGVVDLFLEFNKKYQRAVEMVNDNHRKMKAFQAELKDDMKKSFRPSDMIENLVDEMELPEVKELIAMLNKRAEEADEKTDGKSAGKS